MLWLVMDEASHEIKSCNTCEKDGLFQVWVERANGKSLKVNESSVREEVEVIKDAIDWAIQEGHKTLRLNS